MTAAYIIDAVRTPRARRKGKFTSVHPVDLMTYPLNELVKRNGIEPGEIEDVAVGCVTQTGEQSWCVGRAAVLAAGWPIEVPAATINRLCGSGQQAVNFIASGIQANNYSLAIGGGLEHMTRCPMFSDTGGEVSPLLAQHHPDLVQQGESAEILAEQFGITRDEVDQYAYNSQKRAAAAIEDGLFFRSLVPVPYLDEDGNEGLLEVDDNPRPDTTIEKLGELKTVFRDDGIITAGNASSIVDGAATVLLAGEAAVKKHRLSPRARIVSQAVIGSPPRIMLTGPIAASRLALKRAGLDRNEIDIWEINEAFAPVPIVTMRELEIDPDRVNVNGGAIALGHPLGATGAILVGTALDELERREGRYAMIAMCIGLGMGIATIVERCS